METPNGRIYPTVLHVAGKDNDATDAMYCLDISEDPYNVIEWGPADHPLTYANEVEERLRLLFPVASEQALNSKFPLSPDLIDHYQKKDISITNRLSKRGHNLTTKVIEGSNLIHERGKILIPESLKDRVLDWYHTMLVHPGETQMEASIYLVYT